MIRQLYHRFLKGELSRREFVSRLSTMGVAAASAGQMVSSLSAQRTARPPVRIRKLSNVSGGRITCETLRLWGVEYVFGNTGAYEAGFVDALVDYPDIHYILGLHEGSVMAMADGYARITGRPAFVNVHSITGTANALGYLVNAWADNSPVVVTVGLSSTDAENTGAFTETTGLETVPELYSKLSFRVSRTDTLAESLRRAFQLASTLPSGPVFLGVPMDVWVSETAAAELLAAQVSVRTDRVAPHPGAIRRAAAWLREAENPLLVSGAELPRWGGLAELVEVSDLLGAVVSGDTASSRSSMGFPTRHPRYLGPMRRAVTGPEPFDVVLVAGASRFTLMRGGHPLIPVDARVIELGIREDHLARGYPSDLLIYAHPETTMAALRDELRSSPPAAAVVGRRDAVSRRLKAEADSRRQAVLREVYDSVPIAPERLAREINAAADPAAIVVSETVSSDSVIWDYVEFDQPGGGRRHVVSSGGSLGWGLGAACGVKLGSPRNQVLAVVGDGSYQFATQALWTAKRCRIPLIIVIFNNRAYQANRWALAGLRGRAAETGHYIGISLEHPTIDHVGIARSYGHEGEVVTRPQEIAPALQRAIAAEREGNVYVLDVLIDRRGGGAAADWHEKFSVADLR